MVAMRSAGQQLARPAVGVLVASMLLLAAPEAQANDEEDIAIGTVLGVLGAVDVGFGIYDLVVLADGRDVSKQASAGQLIATGLQANALHIAIIGLAQEREHEVVFGLTFPTMITTALTTQAAWSLARPDADQSTVMLGSTFIGINQAYTMAAIGHGLAGDPSPMPTAIGQIVTSIPTLSLSAYQLSREGAFRSGWMFLTAWSGALLLHGTVSAFHQDDIDDWGGAQPSRRSVWNIEAAPMLSVTPDRSGQPAPFIGIAGRL